MSTIEKFAIGLASAILLVFFGALTYVSADKGIQVPTCITAVILIMISYTPVIYDVIHSTYGTSMPYNPVSPIPERIPADIQMP